MNRVREMTCGLSATEAPPATRRHTYAEIAAILSQRDGTTTTAERVREICGAAERKIACALLADAELEAERIAALDLRQRTFTLETSGWPGGPPAAMHAEGTTP